MASNIVALSGSISGVCALVATYPLLTSVTRQQTERRKTSRGKSASTEEEGIGEKLASLYDGILPALVGTAASQGVYYYFYDIFQRYFESQMRTRTAGKRKELGAGTWLVIAAMAGAVNVLATCPIWLVVTRVQTLRRNRLEKRKRRSKGDKGGEDEEEIKEEEEEIEGEMQGWQKYPAAIATADVYRESGIGGFWRGTIPSLIMVSNPAISYAVYEWLMSQRRRRLGGDRKPSPLVHFLNGAVAKLSATIVTYPMQVVKSRLQASERRSSSTGKVGELGIIVTQIFNENGFMGFYKGLQTKIFQSVLAAALLFVIQDKVRGTLTKLVGQKL